MSTFDQYSVLIAKQHLNLMSQLWMHKFSGIYVPPLNSRCSKCDTQQVPY